MIELNLLEKKKPFVAPTVLGVNLNQLNFKMLAVAVAFYYAPEFIISEVYDQKMAEVQTELDSVAARNDKIQKKIGKDQNIKQLLNAYKTQVEKLQQRSIQVDEILKARTNPRKILEKIARSTPEDLWIDNLTISESNEIKISGGSNAPRAIGEFITFINDSPYFGGSITPSKQENKKETVEGVTGNIDVFELKGKVINYDMRSK